MPESPLQAPARGSSEAVTEIVLERQCFGCEGSYKATLRPDTSATRVFHGNARIRVPERSLAGVVESAEFERLAKLLVAEGFFELADSYRDPQVQDGQWVTTSAIRGGRLKSVVNSNRSGPASLERVEKAIEASIEKIAWQQAVQD